MKRYLLFPLIAIVCCTGFTACQKNYQCTCTDAWTRLEEDQWVTAKSEKKAKQHCESYNSPGTSGQYDCHLK